MLDQSSINRVIGNPHQRRFRPLGDVPLFDKMLRINVLGDILAVESGYEEGCKWGAGQKPTEKSGLCPGNAIMGSKQVNEVLQ